MSISIVYKLSPLHITLLVWWDLLGSEGVCLSGGGWEGSGHETLSASLASPSSLLSTRYKATNSLRDLVEVFKMVVNLSRLERYCLLNLPNLQPQIRTFQFLDLR